MIASAAAIADAEGVEAITLTRVADELGVRQPALYRHIDSYDALIRALSLVGRETLGAALAEAAMGVSGAEAVRAVGRAWRSTVTEHPGLYAATDRSPCTGDPELEEAVERIVEVIAQSLAAFDLTDVDRVHAARSLRSAFHGFTHLESGDGHPHPENLDDSFEELLTLLISGVRNLER